MTLHEQLVDKIHNEQEQYLAEIEKLPPKEIIFKAYQICYREEIVNILEITEFTDKFTKELLKLQNPIATLYDTWLNTDCGVCEMLEDVIRNFEEELI